MDWGNATIANILPGSIDLTLLLQGDFKNTKKLTWLALPPNETDPKDKLTKIELIEYGHLITKAKPKGKDPNKDEVADIANFNGIKRVSALADPDVRPLAEGSMVQFQRKGYYRLDGVNAEGMLQFISIPDGRMH
jgi:glutamyl-tRNA synthetase